MKKVAIVADWLTNRGGAEHVVEALAEAFPAAPVYTSVYNESLFPKLAGRLRGTWLQRLPERLRAKHQWLLPLLPSAFFRLDLREFDVIISSSSAFAKCLTLRPDQHHVCYCHTPTRYLYHAEAEYKTEYKVPWWMRPFKALFWGKLMNYLREQDQRGAKSVTRFIANSNYVADRIQKYYNAEAETVYPCVDVAPFLSTIKPQKRDYFFAVGRFIPYKKFDLLVRAFAENGLNIRLAGIGPELEKCKAIARSLKADNVQFLGFVERDALPALYAGAQAFLFPAEEDFGLTPVEAMAAGTPVIHYNAGGATESVPLGLGVSFQEQTVESLNAAIARFQADFQPDERALRERAKAFDQTVFMAKMGAIIDSL